MPHQKKLLTLSCSLLLTLVPLAASQAASQPATAQAPAAASTTPAAAMPAPTAPTVDARNYVLMDYDSGQVLAEQNGDARAEPASLTKLLTAYVVFSALRDGRLKLTDPVTISEHAWRTGGSRTFAQVGTQIPADILIKGMLVQSGNDATVALAERVGGTEQGFVQLMNEYAKRLGLTGSHFADSNGLPDPNHYTTAHDIARLSAAIIRDFPQYYPIFSLREFTWNKIRQDNRNGLLDTDPTVDGLKTGHTEAAGYCLSASARRNGMRLIAVVMGSDSSKGRENASEALLNYGFNFFQTVTVHKKGDPVLQPRVYKGAQKYVAVAPNADIAVTVPRGQAGSLSTGAKVTQTLLAPLTTTTPVGNFTVTVGGRELVSVPLYPVQAVPRGGLWRRFVDSLALFFQSLRRLF